MEALGILLLGLLVAALILPWVNLVNLSNRKSELRAVQDELETQRRELERLKRQLAEAQTDQQSAVTAQVKAAAVQAPVTKPESPIVTPPPIPKQKLQPSDVKQSEVAMKPVELTKGAISTPTQEDTEPKDWFSKIAIWVGGIALLMAGFFMIKYSIDSGWLTPAVRVWMTTLFGALLCALGCVVSLKTRLKANEKIGQALSGAGVACLYFAVYAAVHLYGFLVPTQGFACMVAVTLVSVGLSLRNGAPIALMGLVGGFLTPWLMSTGSQDTELLFAYLFLLFGAAQFLCVRKGWWGLLLGSAVGAYAWVAVVLAACFEGVMHEPEGALLFVLGICAVSSVGLAKLRLNTLSETVRQILLWLRLLVWGGGLIQALLLVWLGEFAGVDLGMFSVLSLGALALAVLREDEFEWAAWLALLATMLVALMAPAEPFAQSLLWPFGMHLLFWGVGHLQGMRSSISDHWRGLSTIAAWAWVPLLYLNREYINPAAVPFEFFWLLLSLVSAVLLMLSGEHLLRRIQCNESAAVTQSFAFLIVGFGLWATLPVELYGAAAAALLLVATVYWRLRELVRSELVLGTLVVTWTAAMWPSMASAFLYFFGEDWIAGSEVRDVLSMLGCIGGVGSGLLMLRCFWQGWAESVRLVFAWWCGLSTLLAVVSAYQWIDFKWMPDAWTLSGVQGGLTSLLAVWALAFALCCRRRQIGLVGSGVLTALVCVRVVILHLNDSGAEGESFFVNALLWQFGLPFVVISALAWLTAGQGHEALRRAYQVAAMALGFVWASYLVQDYFGGSYLFGGAGSSTELYTYSVVWLLLAVAYQAIGLLRDQKALHVGSLLLLLLTVGKVFFVDASELEGLYRVLSFLGLGCVLIGIGFFYNKVVFGRQRQASAS